MIKLSDNEYISFHFTYTLWTIFEHSIMFIRFIHKFLKSGADESTNNSVIWGHLLRFIFKVLLDLTTQEALDEKTMVYRETAKNENGF